MSEWKEYKLGEVCSRLRSGKNLKSNLIFPEGKYPVWGGNGVRGYTNECNFSGQCCVIGRQGAYCGNVHYYEGEAYMTEHAIVVVGNELADTYYLACALSLMHLENLSAQSAQPGISVQTLSTQTITLPPIDEQKRIAGVLSSLDDKIDLLHRENETLEALAETLFRHYFIENPNPDWKEGTIDDVIEINPARRLSKGENAPYLEMANINTQGCAPLNWYNRPFSSGSKYINGDALMARITPCLENGKAAYIDFLGNGQVGWGSTEFIVLRTRIGLHPFFAYVLTRYSDFRDHAISSLVGSSGRQRVDIDNLRKYSISIPDEKTIKIFNHDMNNVVPKIKNNNHEILTLIQIRDGLLPKLMSNEITL